VRRAQSPLLPLLLDDELLELSLEVELPDDSVFAVSFFSLVPASELLSFPSLAAFLPPFP
jgi:hypothetical protein